MTNKAVLLLVVGSLSCGGRTAVEPGQDSGAVSSPTGPDASESQADVFVLSADARTADGALECDVLANARMTCVLCTDGWHCPGLPAVYRTCGPQEPDAGGPCLDADDNRCFACVNGEGVAFLCEGMWQATSYPCSP